MHSYLDIESINVSIGDGALESAIPSNIKKAIDYILKKAKELWEKFSNKIKALFKKSKNSKPEKEPEVEVVSKTTSNNQMIPADLEFEKKKKDADKIALTMIFSLTELARNAEKLISEGLHVMQMPIAKDTLNDIIVVNDKINQLQSLISGRVNKHIPEGRDLILIKNAIVNNPKSMNVLMDIHAAIEEIYDEIKDAGKAFENYYTTRAVASTKDPDIHKAAVRYDIAAQSMLNSAVSLFAYFVGVVNKIIP